MKKTAKKRFIWLYGESYAKTTSNNSFHTWKHTVVKNDTVCGYYIAEKNKENLCTYKKLSSEERKYFVWKNSKKHFSVYVKADMFIVSLSYKDVMPDKFLFKNLRLSIDRPVVYLQHGTTAIKKLGYTGESYNNNMFKFLYYNKNIKQKVIEENGFNDYQLWYAKFHPRYKELIRKTKTMEVKNQILWFLTWRDYLSDETTENREEKEEKLIEDIIKVVSNKELNEYLKTNSKKLKICLHSFFSDKQVARIKEVLSTNSIDANNIEVIYANEIDVMNEIVQSKMLITDYSSIAFEFTLLDKKVILYQADLDDYVEKREVYCGLDELRENSVSDVNSLVKEIIGDDGKLNQFFKKRLPDVIDYDSLEKGLHIDRIYEELLSYQERKITFLVYDLEIDNEITRKIKKLVLECCKKGYMVTVQNFVSRLDNTKCPNGVNYKAFNNLKYTSKYAKIRRLWLNIFSINKKFKYDDHKIYKSICYDIRRFLKKDNGKFIVSADECLTNYLKNKDIEFLDINDDILGKL